MIHQNKQRIRPWRRFLLLAIILPTQVTIASPSLSLAKHQFITRLSSGVTQANQAILRDREQVIRLQQAAKQQPGLNKSQRNQIQHIAKAYSLGSFRPENPQQWQTLLSRVDSVPASLAVAQAINESAWGTSRFAKEGHNLFGIWCFSAGCGMVPHQRPQGKTYEVQRFANQAAAIDAYLKNLNTHRAYQGLRAARAQQRAEHHVLTGIELAQHLHRYSSKQDRYITLITDIIQRYHLDQLDKRT